MSDKHISDLLPAVSVGEGDEFHIAQSGVDKRLPYNILFNAMTNGLAEAIEEVEELVEEATIASTTAIQAKNDTVQLAQEAADSASQASDSEDNSKDSELNAAGSETLARRWASAPENEIVQDTYYSAYHYMKKTQASQMVVEQAETVAVDAANEVTTITQNMPTFTVATTLPTGIPQDGDMWIYIEEE